MVAHHLALCGVGVDVPAEQRGCDEQRHGPDRDHEHDALDREAAVPVQVTEETDPHAGEEDEPPEHQRQGGDRRQRVVGRGRTEQAAGHAEEPRSRKVGLEGLATEDGAHDDGRGTDEPQHGSARDAQPGLRLRRRPGLGFLGPCRRRGGSAR